MKEEIEQLVTELQMLCKRAWYEPQAVYLCAITGFKHKTTYFMRTIPNINNQIKQLDEIVRTEFIPAINCGINCSDIYRKLPPFPAKLRGLGIPISSEKADGEYKFSRMISKDLITNILNQHRHITKMLMQRI